METFPKRGMTYSQSLPKAQRFVKEGSKNLVDSVTNQVRIHEGEKAAREFSREVHSKGREYKPKKYFY